jgi:predicted nucleotidyltransferase
VCRTTLDRGRSLLDLGAFLMDVHELLDYPVDVVTEAGLKPRLRDRVLLEAVPL